jgi:hypothetical protein
VKRWDPFLFLRELAINCVDSLLRWLFGRPPAADSGRLPLRDLAGFRGEVLVRYALISARQWCIRLLDLLPPVRAVQLLDFLIAVKRRFVGRSEKRQMPGEGPAP